MPKGRRDRAGPRGAGGSREGSGERALRCARERGRSTERTANQINPPRTPRRSLTALVGDHKGACGLGPPSFDDFNVSEERARTSAASVCRVAILFHHSRLSRHRAWVAHGPSHTLLSEVPRPYLEARGLGRGVGGRVSGNGRHDTTPNKRAP